MSEYGFIAHHGIKGQKWGIQNGPPYPIGSDGQPKGAHRHIVKGKLSDKQKKLLKGAAVGAGITAASLASIAAAGAGAYVAIKHPELVTRALSAIGGKAMSALGKAGIMTGKAAIQKLMKESPEIFNELASKGIKITGKEAKNILKSQDLSNIIDKAIASGDKNQINKVIIDNIDKFKNNSKALGKAAPFVDDAIKSATKGLSKKQLDNHPLKNVSLQSIQTQADAIAKATKAGSKNARWGAKIAGITGGVATAGLGVNSVTNSINDINRLYNTKNNALSKDIKKLISNALVSKNHYDNYDEKERRKR